MAHRGLIALTALLVGCGHPPRAPLPGKWVYDVTFPDDPENGTVAVVATFEQVGTGTLRFRNEVGRDVRSVTVQGGETALRQGDAWVVPTCASRCTVSYTLSVRRVVEACHDDLGCAVGVDGAVIAPVTTWLVRPSPKRDVPALVRLHGAFESGLGRGKADPLRSIDLDEGSYVAFGATHAESRVSGALVRVGRTAADSETVDAAWAGATSMFKHLSPLRPRVFVFNTNGDSRGKVMALSGASVALDTGKDDDADRERVALHEFTHLAVPTFRGEGRWVGEGFAVYFEARMRAANGSLSRAAFVEHLRSLARTVPQRVPLAVAEDEDSIYGGGALFALLLDVELRTHCRSLSDAVNVAMRHGANATRVMRVRDYFALLSVASRSDAPLDLFQRVAVGGERIDLDALFLTLSSQEALGTGAKHCADVP